MDPAFEHVKREKIEKVSPETVPVSDHFDYNRLYGDLCRKLLSTPVTEIFSGANQGVSPTIFSNGVISGIPQTSVSEHLSSVTLPTFYQSGMQADQTSLFGGLYNQTGVFDTVNLTQKMEAHVSSEAVLGGELPEDTSAGSTDNSLLDSMDSIAQAHEPIDIQALVDQFRLTLERFGVSQRFAARFIMQDTSQGNLSFLMEKGRVKKWDELSPRGRIPYIKMKAWLENKDLQLNTLNMLKYSQEMRKNSPKEPYNRRERFSMFQLNVLCRLYEENPNPPMTTRNAVAERLNIPLDRVNVWFQNQRARGFPARRILQQHAGLYSDNMQSDVDVAREITRTAKNGKLYTPTRKTSSPPTTGSGATRQELSVNINNIPPDRVEKTPKASNNDKKSPVLKVPSLLECRLPPNAFPEPTLTPPHSSTVNTELFDVPLDLSSSKQSTAAVSSQQVKQETKESCRPAETTTPCVPLYGASKRKRGCRPQQIIQKTRNIPNEESFYDSKMKSTHEHETTQKRRKLSDDSFPTIDTQKNDGYDYVIKSEITECNISDETAQLHTRDGKECENHKTALTSNEQCISNIDETGDSRFVQNNVRPNDSKVELERDDNKENSAVVGEGKTTEAVLLKAMCASIAMDKRSPSSESVNLVEPELD